MTLARKDIRAKLDSDMHRALKIFARSDGITEGEYIERLLLPHLRERVHVTTLAAAELTVAGISGKNRESSGTPGNVWDAGGHRK